MRLITVCLGLVFCVCGARGAELAFDLSTLREGELPPGWRATVTGGGGPAKWGIVSDDVSSELERFSELAPVTSIRPVVAQRSRDHTDERFPLLVYDQEEFGDFKLTTKFKMVAGETASMAGIAFRILDERNYHVIRASSKGSNLLFYSFIDGQRTQPVGVNATIPTNVWHTLEIEAEATKFKFKLNGEEIMPTLDNPNFRRGKIGYWTKSDAVSHFVDTRIVYRPRVIHAQRLITSALERFDRLLGLRVVVAGADDRATSILASSEAAEIDQPGGIPEERLVIEKGEIMYLAAKDNVTVTLPLRDRNGDIIAAVRVTMKRFAGQTQKNAILRAQPVVAHFQRNVFTADSLMD